MALGQVRTVIRLDIARRRDVFDSRAHEGRDKVRNSIFVIFEGFQPTRPRGARNELPNSAAAFQVVSIRAPATGATTSRKA